MTNDELYTLARRQWDAEGFPSPSANSRVEREWSVFLTGVRAGFKIAAYHINHLPPIKT